MRKCTLKFVRDVVEGQPCPLTFGSVSRRELMHRWAA